MSYGSWPPHSCTRVQDQPLTINRLFCTTFATRHPPNMWNTKNLCLKKNWFMILVDADGNCHQDTSTCMGIPPCAQPCQSDAFVSVYSLHSGPEKNIPWIDIPMALGESSCKHDILNFHEVLLLNSKLQPCTLPALLCRLHILFIDAYFCPFCLIKIRRRIKQQVSQGPGRS